MHSPRAVAHPPTDPVTLLHSLLTSPAYPAIVLVCATQADFVRELLYDSNVENATTTHRLLRPTLHALSIAPHISTVFTPTVSHLRAWLTVADKYFFAPYPPSQPFDAPKNVSNAETNRPAEAHRGGRLVVWNLVRNSCHTSEWSVQGLSETLAALIDCGQRLGCSIALAEAVDSATEMEQHNVGTDDEDEAMHDVPVETEDQDNGNHAGDDIGTPEAVPAQNNIYHRRLPMLNGSSRRPGLDDSSVWSGRTVEVGVVLKRWLQVSSIEI